MRQTISELMAEQRKLAAKVRTVDLFSKLELVGGVDQAYTRNAVISGLVVLNYADLSLVARASAVRKVRFPYIPGFLSYRELPAIAAAWSRLRLKPNILLVDGHGIAHPRRFGIACHVGLVLDVPTIGVAKSLLKGKLVNNKILLDREVRGVLLRARPGASPIYVSPGHGVSLESAASIVAACMKAPHRLPEPLHLAHQLANKRASQLRHAS